MAAKKSRYETGERLAWDWGDGTGTGKVEDVFTCRVTMSLQGSDVTRNATADEPAYLVRQDDGDEVLKSHSEVRKA